MLPSSLQLIPPADTVLPSTPSGNLRSAAASSDHLREIRRAKLCLQPQWSHPEAVHLYPFTILPKRPGLPCFLGRFAPAASACPVSPRQRGPQGSRRVAAATRCSRSSRLQPRHHRGRIWVCWKHRVPPGLKSQGGRRIATWADTNVCLHLPP